jgi:hypothetical protein
MKPLARSGKYNRENGEMMARKMKAGENIS